MRVVLVGYGVVGQALVALVESQRGALLSRYGLEVRFVGVADSRGAAVAARGLEAGSLLKARREGGSVGAMEGAGRPGMRARELILGCEADAVVEAGPSVLRAPQGAIENLKAAFATGKHAVCVNKAPLAVAMPGLVELARHNRVALKFSGAVGAGTPVLALAERCAMGDEVLGVRAILNGTTNFILSRMHGAGEAFEAALAEAVRLGYAEADPSADIDGVDTASKLVILTNHVLRRATTFADVRVEGIRGMAAERVAEAKRAGMALKLVGTIDAEGTRVGPEGVPMGSPLDVPGSLNAVTLTLRAGGDVTVVGRGAGGAETATAILRDLVDIWTSGAGGSGRHA